MKYTTNTIPFFANTRARTHTNAKIKQLGHSKNEDRSVLRLLTNRRSPARRTKISAELKNPCAKVRE